MTTNSVPPGEVSEKKPLDSRRWFPISSLIVRVLLVGFVVVSLMLILFLCWPRPVEPISNVSSGMTLAEKEAAFKEKVESYSKRVDDLQRISSVLLGLATVYAIALGLSAYASVQANLAHAEKTAEKAEGLVSKADQSAQTLQTLTLDFQSSTRARLEELRKAALDIDDKSTYATRVAIATLVSNPLKPEVIKILQEDSIGALTKLRDGNYSTDEFVNLRLARLYRSTNQLRRAEEVLTSFIARKEALGQRDDLAVEKAFFNRACYQSLRWVNSDSEKRKSLKVGIQSDLDRAIALNDQNKKDAQDDSDFDSVKAEEWFQALTRTSS